MPKVYEGSLIAKALKFALIVARFNEFVTGELVTGCVDTLKRHGAEEDSIDIFYVPGSFEIPYLADKLSKTKDYDAIICLGTVIRGETPHFDYICKEVARGIANASVQSGVPVVFGVIMADTVEQAIERAGTKAGNRGRDAALTAVEMANLYNTLKQ